MFPVFYKIRETKKSPVSGEHILLQLKFLLSNSTKNKFIFLYHLGFLRKDNGSWCVSTVTACLGRLLFLQLPLKLIHNTHFDYFGMG